MNDIPPNRLAVHWHPREKQLEAAYLNGTTFRVERINDDNELHAFSAVLAMLKPCTGVEVQASWIWPVASREQLAVQQFETLALLEPYHGRLREHSLPCGQASVHSTTFWARRRALGEFVAVTTISGHRCAAAMNARRSQYIGQASSTNSMREILATLKESSNFVQPARPWLLFGRESARDAPVLADEFCAEKLIVPAHSGAVSTVELLMSDHYLRIGRLFENPSMLPGDSRLSDEVRVRAMFRDLMDEASREAFRLGFDTDDLTCNREVCVQLPNEPHPSCFADDDDDESGCITRAIEYCSLENKRQAVEIESHESRTFVCSVLVSARIETHKAALPPVAISTTMSGAGEPEDHVFNGPGKMSACLCEIDVPAGWRAEWEPCGDVVMTRV